MSKITTIVLLLMFLVGLAVSCGEGPKEATVSEPYHIYLDPTPSRDDVPFPTLSEMVDQIEYVKLEYAPDLPVGTIYDYSARPVITDQYIIVSDPAQGVLQFSRSGKFIRRIGHIGRGPGEYGGNNNIMADEKRGIVYIIYLNRAIKFELATGKFIEETTITGMGNDPSFLWGPMSPVSMTDSVWLMSQGNVGMFISADSKADVYSWFTLEVPTMRIIHRERSRLFDNPPAGNLVVSPTPTWHDPLGRVNFYQNLADTMVVVNADGSTIPRIIPDFGPHKLKSPAFDEQGVGVGTVKESGRYILFEVGSRSATYLISLDKETGERGQPQRLKPVDVRERDFFFGPANDIDGGFSRFLPYDEHIWWASFDAFEMMEKLTPEHFESVRSNVRYPDRLEKLQTLVGSLQENDNPVIAIAKLKK